MVLGLLNKESMKFMFFQDEMNNPATEENQGGEATANEGAEATANEGAEAPAEGGSSEEASM